VRLYDLQSQGDATTTTSMTSEDGRAGHRDLRDVLVYLLPLVGASLLPFITLPIFTRLLTPADYGYLALAAIYAAAATGVASLGLVVGFEREYFECEDQDGGAGLLYSALLTNLGSLVLVFAISWRYRAAFSGWIIGSSEHSSLLLAVFAAVGSQTLRTYVLIYFRNQRRARTYTAYVLAESFLSAAFSLLLVAWLRIGVIGLPLGQLAGASIILLVMSFHLLTRLPFSLSRPALVSALRTGLPVTARTPLTVASTHLDKYLIALLATVGGVGLYSIGQKLSYLVFSFMTALENVFSPRALRMMFAGDVDHAVKIGRYLTPFAYFSAFGALGLVLFAEEALAVLTPVEYHSAAPIVSVLALHYAAMFFAKQKQLIFAKKTHLLPVISAVSLALSLGLNIVFIQLWGALGAAGGTLTAGLLTLCLTVSLSQKYFFIDYEVGKMVGTFGLLTLAAVSTLLLDGFGLAYPIRIVVKFLWLGSFLRLGFHIGILNKRSLMMMARALGMRASDPKRVET